MRHGRIAALGAALLFVIAMAVGDLAFAQGQRRVALVIGNSAYQNVPPLANPKNDASDMAAKLQGLGFEVVSGLDLDLNQMRATVRDFVKRLEGAHMALYFYAGHGLQVNGVNYMAPVDSKLSSFDDLEFEAMPMDPVLAAMERNAKVNLAFLDACRNNPLAQNLARSMGTRSVAVGNGLARLGSGVGTLIAFATQPGNVALDGAGRNSPFTGALLKHLGTPGQDITRDLIFVRRDVLEATGGKQVPWDNSSLTGEVILLPGELAAPEANETAKPDSSFEMTYWESIKAADDKSFFRKYLERFPGGLFADLADMKIGVIEAREAAEAAKVESDRKAAEEEQKKFELAKLEEAKAQERAKAEEKKPELPGLPGSENNTQSNDPNLARRFTVASLGPDADPRLVNALAVLGRYEIGYGVFRKNLYIAVLTWGGTWRQAHELAGKVGGHLVTISDKAENDFAYKLFISDDRFVETGADHRSGPYIGLYQPVGSKEPNGGWRWVTNEPLKYLNWGINQPDNNGGQAGVAYFWSPGSVHPSAEQRPIRWDDRPDNDNRGFIVEFEASDRG